MIDCKTGQNLLRKRQWPYFESITQISCIRKCEKALIVTNWPLVPTLTNIIFRYIRKNGDHCNGCNSSRKTYNYKGGWTLTTKSGLGGIELGQLLDHHLEGNEIKICEDHNPTRHLNALHKYNQFKSYSTNNHISKECNHRIRWRANLKWPRCHHSRS